MVARSSMPQPTTSHRDLPAINKRLLTHVHTSSFGEKPEPRHSEIFSVYPPFRRAQSYNVSRIKMPTYTYIGRGWCCYSVPTRVFESVFLPPASSWLQRESFFPAIITHKCLLRYNRALHGTRRTTLGRFGIHRVTRLGIIILISRGLILTSALPTYWHDWDGMNRPPRSGNPPSHGPTVHANSRVERDDGKQARSGIFSL
ncbi:hypothetical protein F4861DRAFT_416127 [Xylaria intraflava]|nr:hypothetical protein F4861DRAFT_416127 [Xylaria intraflava]